MGKVCVLVEHGVSLGMFKLVAMLLSDMAWFTRWSRGYSYSGESKDSSEDSNLGWLWEDISQSVLWVKE